MADLTLTFLSQMQIIELDRLCAEVAQTGFGRVALVIENGHARWFETATTRPAPTIRLTDKPPPRQIAANG